MARNINHYINQDDRESFHIFFIFIFFSYLHSFIHHLLLYIAAPTDAAFLEEVSDIIHAAQLQNAIAKEKNKVLRIIGNSNEPRRQMYSRLVPSRHDWMKST